MVIMQPDPAGFMMGAPEDEDEASSDEKPAHRVVFGKPFAIGKYEVSFAEYDKFAYDTNRRPPGDQGWGGGRRPVINVSWEDAVAYAQWLSEKTGKRYRLPTEAEWEYAARSGGKKEKWAGTSDENALGDYAWFGTNSGGESHPVGEKKPNGLGLYDMSDNVWEWVADCDHDNYKGAPEDGSARDSGSCGLRVLRGGSWYNYGPGYLRSATRYGNFPVSRHDGLGFRLVQDL